ncbi:AAA family ATPase [Rothia dentocariosa]|jgi:hypothetical protein|uniref:AAA family ATPase n=1 Tax=Rothia dentocariosa TaxID=2047 RepID=UPI00145572D8|nr:ATP-binding protein [Rothia dentocariosa]NLR24690.1 AAA family ATPase [Rothia dentocariosa]
MAEIAEQYEKDLARLAHLSLESAPEDIKLYLARMSRKYRMKNPQLSDEIASLLKATKIATTNNNTPTRLKVGGALKDDYVLPHGSLIKTDEGGGTTKPVLPENIAKAIKEIILERNYQDKLRKHGLEPISTAVFTGPPGVGKTVTAQWVASELKLPLVTLDLTSVMSSKLGQSGANLRSVLDYARKNRCILFLDEIDAIAKSRFDESDIGELKRIVTILLQELNNWTKDSLLIAATNHPEIIDAALWRRFEIVIEFPLPDSKILKAAIESFSEGDEKSISKYIEILTVVFAGESLSRVKDEIFKMRKNNILKVRTFDESVNGLLENKIESMSSLDKKKVAYHFYSKSGWSQRKAAATAGISRDTLRKFINDTKES